MICSINLFPVWRKNVKATIFNGSDKDDRSLADIDSILVDELSSRAWEVESFTLHEMKIAYCVGCFECWVKTPGECRFKDDGHEIVRQFVRSDLAILLTPVTFGGYSAELKKGMDRLICTVSPFFMKINGEMHHRKRYDKSPLLLGLGVLPGEDKQSKQIFTSLVKRNSINMHSPAQKGAVIVSGQRVDTIRQEIRSCFNQLGVSQ